MKKIRLLLISILGIVLLFSSKISSTVGEPNQFVIEYADGTRYVNMTGSSELNGLISSVAPRFVIEYANMNRFVDLIPIPTEFEILLGEVTARFVIEFANGNRFVPLSYPSELIGDTLAPIILSQEAIIESVDTINITWTTDELTEGLIDYGLQSHHYTDYIADDSFRTQHTVTINSLSPGTTVYYHIMATDRSGNVTISSEYSIDVDDEKHIFLPFIVR